MENEFCFERGWSQVRQCDVKPCREQLMEAMNVHTPVGFLQRRRGLIVPKVTEARRIEEIFRSFGITDVWGDPVQAQTKTTN